MSPTPDHTWRATRTAVAATVLAALATAAAPAAATQPGRNGAIARHRGQIDRGRAAAEERFELGAPLGLGVRAKIAAVDRQEIEADEARRRRLGQLGDARGRGMEPELERVEVEPRGRSRPALIRCTRRTSSPSSVGKSRFLPRRTLPASCRPTSALGGGSNVFRVAM